MMPLHSVHQEILNDVFEEIYGVRLNNGEFADLTFEEYKIVLENLEFERDLNRMIQDKLDKQIRELGGK